MPQESEVEEVPGIIVNVHRDWDALIDAIKHQPTFLVYEEHINSVIDETLRVIHNRQALNAELNAIEDAVTAPPNSPLVAQKFYAFSTGLLDFIEFLHQHQGEDFERLREQFDEFWPYEGA
jgi:hypothetical protein